MDSDLISRSALKVEFKEIYHIAETLEQLANAMEDAIDNAPTVSIELGVDDVSPCANCQEFDCYGCKVKEKEA